MSGSRSGSFSDAFGRVFPERRIYIRSDARTRYWTLSPISQCGLACVLAAGIGWSALTSYAFLDTAMDGRTAESRLDAAEDAHEIQLAALREQQRLLEHELNRSNARGDAVTRQLSEKQRLLVETATRLQTADAELAGLRAEVEALSGKRRDELAEMNALSEEIVRLRLALAEAGRREATMDETLATFSRSMTRVIAARDSAAERVAALDGRVAELETDVAAWQARQESLLAQLEQATNSSLATLDKIFVDTDIDLESILDETKRDYSGQGGPFEELAGIPDEAEPVAEERVAALVDDLERVSLMRIAVDRLPFGMPTQGARLTSGFGARKDPFRGRRANHEGIDFAAPTGTPIYATAEGLVTFAGRQSGYGNVVKIRHAFGFETVYAHLSKSRVQVGQRVERGMRIGDMGSTGRSTGSHLHYEVRIDGQAVNPNEFIRAARHVL